MDYINFNIRKALDLKNSFIIFILITILSSVDARSQIMRPPDEPHPFWSQVRFGGGVGLAFGNGYFNGSLTPSAIYDFNQTFSAGVGVNAAYASRPRFNATSLGGSLIGMARPIREIQLSTEFEQLHITRRYNVDGANLKNNDWVPALFVGAGYNTGSVVVGMRYDLLHDNQRSFYSNAFMPFVNIYF